jgi:hypothetical protein
MKNLSLVALFSLFFSGCFIGERLSNLDSAGNCSVDINNDGAIDDSDCTDPIKPGEPSDPCAPNADGTIEDNCVPPPCGCEDPSCNDGPEKECNVDTNNDGIIDGSDCGGDPTNPGDPCAPNADGSIDPNCNPCTPDANGNCVPSKCFEDTNGDNIIDDSDCSGEPIPCEVDTNNDGLINDDDCTGEPIKPDPCAPNADGSIDPSCVNNPGDPCAPDANGNVGANCPAPCDCNVDTNNDGVIDNNDC